MTLDHDVVVVGAGFFGATIAECCARELGKRVLIMDRRGHIGGNSFSEIHGPTGIEIHRYGTHIFHTPNKKVWDYLSAFTKFSGYQHRVYASTNGNIYPLPINLATVSQVFGRHFTPAEALELIEREASELRGAKPSNLEEKAISLIGRRLYEMFIKGYTAKQWQTDPKQLSESIINRLPVRFDFNNRYFSDAYEGMPLDGYTRIFERMLENPLIDLRLNTDYFEVKNAISQKVLTIYTGPIDRFFEYKAGSLNWRTIDLHLETVDTQDFQGTSVINYPDESVPFTRIHEYRHLHPERSYQGCRTVIAREYSRFSGPSDEPYYPIDTPRDKNLYAVYAKLAEDVPNVIFGGRLGTYRYLDMHQAIAMALKTFETEVVSRLRGAISRNVVGVDTADRSVV